MKQWYFISKNSMTHYGSPIKHTESDDVWTCPKCNGTDTQSRNFEMVWYPRLDAYLAEPITIWCMKCQKEFDVFKVKVQFT